MRVPVGVQPHQHLVFSIFVYLFSNISNSNVCVVASHDLDPFLLRILFPSVQETFLVLFLQQYHSLSHHYYSFPEFLSVQCWASWIVSHLFSQIFFYPFHSKFCAISLNLSSTIVYFPFNFIFHIYSLTPRTVFLILWFLFHATNFCFLKAIVPYICVRMLIGICFLVRTIYFS